MGYFTLLKQRWTSATPTFFKRFVKLGCGIGSIGVGCLPFSTSLPVHVQGVPGYCIAIGVAVAGLAKLTSNDPDVVQKSDSFFKPNG